DGIRDFHVTGVQTCALPIFRALALGGDRDLLPVPGVEPEHGEDALGVHGFAAALGHGNVHRGLGRGLHEQRGGPRVQPHPRLDLDVAHAHRTLLISSTLSTVFSSYGV